ncbi:MAG: LVIVD repeat-containing protein [Promethearchaeota archaeon]
MTKTYKAQLVSLSFIFILLVLTRSTETAEANEEIILTEIGSIPYARTCDVKVKDEILYVLQADYGLVTYDISDPTTPSRLGRCTDTYTFVHALVIEDEYAYVADYEDGLEIVDISDPSDLTIIGDYTANLGAGSTDVYKLGDLAFLASQGIGLEIINCSDVNNPVKIGSYYENYRVIRVYSSNDQIFLCEATNGFKILNITGNECTEIFHFQDTVSYQEFFVLNNILYTTTRDGILIFDIHDLSNIKQLGGKDIGESFGAIIRQQNNRVIAYVSSWEAGVQILDVNDPENIEIIGQYTDGGQAYNLDVRDNLIFVADFQDGIEIIQVEHLDLSSMNNNNYESSTSTSTTGFTLFVVISVLIFSIVHKRRQFN